MGPATIVARSTRNALPGPFLAAQGFGPPNSGGPVIADPRSGAAQRSLLGRVVINIMAIFVLTIVAGLAALVIGPRLLGYQNVMVDSGSMAPSLREADIVVLAPPTAERIQVGTVINYRVAGGHRIHRIIEITPAGYRTQGDANRVADSELVRHQDVTGLGIYLVPVVGLPRFWAGNGEWLKVSFTLAVLVGSAHASRRRFVEAPEEPGYEVLNETLVRRRTRSLSK
ncbi:MAG: signal peptidase I [Actinomycetia bacterium]|nr:signal peptidase I [Actinomycetes bacterium]